MVFEFLSKKKRLLFLSFLRTYLTFFATYSQQVRAQSLCLAPHGSFFVSQETKLPGVLMTTLVHSFAGTDMFFRFIRGHETDSLGHNGSAQVLEMPKKEDTSEGGCLKEGNTGSEDSSSSHSSRSKLMSTKEMEKSTREMAEGHFSSVDSHLLPGY